MEARIRTRLSALLAHDVEELDAAGLRKFAFILATAFVALFVGIPWWRHGTVTTWPFVVAGVLVALALVAPRLLRFVYVPWMKLGSALGYVNTRIILSLFFIVVVLPLALLVRVLGKDPLARTFDPKVVTYRIISRVRDPKTMEKPF